MWKRESFSAADWEWTSQWSGRRLVIQWLNVWNEKYLHCRRLWIFQAVRKGGCNFKNLIATLVENHIARKLLFEAEFLYSLKHDWRGSLNNSEWSNTYYLCLHMVTHTLQLCFACTHPCFHRHSHERPHLKHKQPPLCIIFDLLKSEAGWSLMKAAGFSVFCFQTWTDGAGVVHLEKWFHVVNAWLFVCAHISGFSITNPPLLSCACSCLQCASVLVWPAARDVSDRTLDAALLYKQPRPGRQQVCL